MRSAKCEVRNVDTSCQMPEASQNGKLEMASGKLRGFADYKCEMQSVDARYQEALQEVKLKYLR